MAKLTKAEAKAHADACALLQKDTLTIDERWSVYENWNEAAHHINSSAGAFFTPADLAADFAIDCSGPRVIDLCAGIGVLSFACFSRWRHGEDVRREFVCVEKNPDYVAVGKKLFPEATWICADVFDVPKLGLGRFDCALGNPPFGATPRQGKGPRYTGRAFEYHVIDIAADLADYGTFIIPQNSAPFRYSGVQCHQHVKSEHYQEFEKATGVRLDIGCGVDCSYHRDKWKGVAPAVEIVCADFTEARRAQRIEAMPQGDLFVTA